MGIQEHKVYFSVEYGRGGPRTRSLAQQLKFQMRRSLGTFLPYLTACEVELEFVTYRQTCWQMRALYLQCKRFTPTEPQ